MDEEEERKILSGIWGRPYQATKDLNSVPVTLRTLLDSEVLNCIDQSVQYTAFEQQIFHLTRWKLAHSLIAVNDIRLPESVKEKYDLILTWINFYVEELLRIYEEVVSEEKDLGEILKNSGAIQ